MMLVLDMRAWCVILQVLANLRKEIGNLPEVIDEEDDAAYERVMTDRITANQGEKVLLCHDG
jgi:hypothetical protein